LPPAQDHAADEGVARGDEGDVAAPEQDLVVPVIHLECPNAVERRQRVNGKCRPTAYFSMSGAQTPASLCPVAG
jgi:hypothetical protein